MLISLQQRVLHHILGVLRMAADKQAEPVRHLLCLNQQLLHRVLVATGGGADERRVVRSIAPRQGRFRALHSPDSTREGGNQEMQPAAER